MRGLTSTKRRRLAIIIAVGVVFYGSNVAFQEIGSRRADDAARELAGRVHEQLRSHDRADADRFLTEMSIAAWEGRSTSPFRVDGTDPQTVNEVDGALVARYRVQRLGAERCVDARWPEHGAFRVRVNDCHGYEP